MCLAVPGKIEEIDRLSPMTMARVNFEGVSKEICIEWVPDAKIGDYVVVHAGFALTVLDEDEALENLRVIREVTEMPNSYNKW